MGSSTAPAPLGASAAGPASFYTAEASPPAILSSSNRPCAPRAASPRGRPGCILGADVDFSLPVSILLPFPRCRPSRAGMALPFLSTPSPYPATCEAIYRAHLRDVVRWTRRFGAPAREAEDIAQLVFLAL